MLHKSSLNISSAFGPSKKLFNLYFPTALQLLKQEVEDAIRLENIDLFEKLIQANPFLINLRYTNDKKSIFELCLGIKTASAFMFKFTLEYINYIDMKTTYLMGKEEKENSEVIFKMQQIYKNYLQKIKSKNSLLQNKNAYSQLITIEIEKTLDILQKQVLGIPENLELFFCINTLLLAIEETDQLENLQDKIRKFLNVREDFLCGDGLDYCYTLTLANELCCKITEIIFPNENPVNILLHNARTRDRQRPWLNPITYDNELPLNPNEFFRTSNNEIHLYSCIVEQACEELEKGSVDLSHIWKKTDNKSHENDVALTLADLSLLKMRSPALKEFVEYTERLSNGSQGFLFKMFDELRLGLLKGNRDNEGSEYQAGNSGYNAVIAFAQWWNNLNDTFYEKDIKKEIGELSNGEMKEIIELLLTPGDNSVQNVRSRISYCIKTLGDKLENILRNSMVQQKLSELENKINLRVSVDQLHRWREAIFRELKNIPASFSNAKDSFFRQILFAWPSLMEADSEKDILNYYKLGLTEKELLAGYILLAERESDIAFKLYHETNEVVFQCLAGPFDTFFHTSLLQYVIAMRTSSKKELHSLKHIDHPGFPRKSDDWIVLTNLFHFATDNETRECIFEFAIEHSAVYPTARVFQFIKDISTQLTINEKHLKFTLKKDADQAVEFLLDQYEELKSDTFFLEAVESNNIKCALAYLQKRIVPQHEITSTLIKILNRKYQGVNVLAVLAAHLFLKNESEFDLFPYFQNEKLTENHYLYGFFKTLNKIATRDWIIQHVSADFLCYILEKLFVFQLRALNIEVEKTTTLLLSWNFNFNSELLRCALVNNLLDQVTYILEHSEITNNAGLIEAAQLGLWEVVQKYLDYRIIDSLTLSQIWLVAFKNKNFHITGCTSTGLNEFEKAELIKTALDQEWKHLLLYLDSISDELGQSSSFFSELLLIAIQQKNKEVITTLLNDYCVIVDESHLVACFDLGKSGYSILETLLEFSPLVTVSDNYLLENELYNWKSVKLYLATCPFHHLSQAMQFRHGKKILVQFNELLTQYLNGYETRTVLKNLAIQTLHDLVGELNKDDNLTEIFVQKTLIDCLQEQIHKIKLHHRKSLFKGRHSTLVTNFEKILNDFKNYLLENDYSIETTNNATSVKLSLI